MEKRRKSVHGRVARTPVRRHLKDVFDVMKWGFIRKREKPVCGDRQELDLGLGVGFSESP